MQTQPLANPPKHDHWQWQGNSIYYVQTGVKQTNKPPLLLIHGFGASTDHWRKNIHQLQHDWEIWAIDLLGFGRSAKPDLEYSGHLWRDQINDFISNVIQKPVILAGNSLGGYASLCVAADYPDHVKGVILLNSAGPFSDSLPTEPTNPLQKMFRQGVRSLLLQPWINNLLFQYSRRPATIRKTLKKVYFDQNAVTDQLVADIHRPSCDPGAAQVFASVFKTPQGECVDSLLARMSCPLFTIWGQADPWMKTKERGAKFRQYYPQLQEIYLQAGHCPHDEIPEEVNRLISDWVSKFVI